MPNNSEDVTPGAPAPASEKSSSWSWLNPTKWIETIGGVVTRGLGYAPREHVGIIVIAFLLVVLALLIGIGLLYADRGTAAGVIILSTIIGLIVAIFLLRPKGTLPRVSPAVPTARTRLGRWARVMVNLPLSVETLNHLSEKLGSIRSLAQTKYTELLQQRGPSVDPERVRVNIFLPDTRDAVEVGEVCGLFIPRGLHQGMRNEAERRIRFRTNEGLTGRVYTEQRPLGARRDSRAANWEAIPLEGMGKIEDAKFQLTEEQVGLIDAELRWIISFPLSVSKDGAAHTLGVFNVDGLAEILSVNEMREMYQALRVEIHQLTTELDKLPQCLVTIFVDSLNGRSVSTPKLTNS